MMVEGEASQEPTAPEGASAPPPPDSPTEAEAASEVVKAEEPAEEAPVAEAEGLSWSHLSGFQTLESPPEAMAGREDYAAELQKELAARAARFARSVDESIVLSSDGVMRWLGDPVARIVASDDLLAPRPVLLADDALGAEDRSAVETRATLWLGAHIRKILGSLTTLAEGADLPEGARALGAKIAEALGVLDRERVRLEVRGLDQTARGALRKLGVRFGSLYIYVPQLLKPAARGLCSLLWTLKRGSETGADRLLGFAAAGRTSFANEGLLSPDSYRVAGFRLSGERVVRVDIIERLSDLIRAAIPDHMRAGSRPVTEAYGFAVTPQMTSLTGCSGEAFASILRSLGFEPVKVSKAAYEAANRKAPMEPIKAAEAAAAEADTTEAAEVSQEADAVTASDEVAADPVEEPAEAVEAAPADAVQPEASDAQPEETVAQVEAPAEIVEGAPVEAAQPEASEVEAEPEKTAAQGEASEPTASDDSAETAEPVEAAAVSDDAAEAAPVEAAPAASDEEIEIWRPAPRRPRAPQRPPREEREARPAQGKPQYRRHGQHGHHRPTEPATPSEAPAAAEARPSQETPRQPRRDDQPRRFEGKPKDDRRPPQRDFAPRREPKQADPDSPFAKLAALKPLLERRDKRP